MIATDLDPVEDLEPKTQQDELPIEPTADVYTVEDDPVIPPFSPPD